MTTSSQNELSTIEEVIADAKAGKLFILVDDEDRENEGDLCVVADVQQLMPLISWQNMGEVLFVWHSQGSERKHWGWL